MSGQPKEARGFDHVEAWVFDLDNTLYPADCNLFAQINRRMGEFIAQELGLNLDEAQALRQTYYYEHGTTLAGLVRQHGISPDAFLDYVHDIDLSAIAASPELWPRSMRCRGGNSCSPTARADMPRRGGAARRARALRGHLRHPRA